jgi:hypothetical protein
MFICLTISQPSHYTRLSRGVAQLASAPRLGRGGRRFKSAHPDHKTADSTWLAVSLLRGFHRPPIQANKPPILYGQQFPFSGMVRARRPRLISRCTFMVGGFPLKRGHAPLSGFHRTPTPTRNR